jgi:diketogulonate reductase-like aldo/keto reductase
MSNTLSLPTGANIAQIGLGTWQISQSDTRKVVATALDIGYRLIDTAKIYGNEKEVGEAIRDSDIAREEIFATTKLWNDDQGYEPTLKACQASLQRLDLDYLDLYLIHWPASGKRHESWRAMEKLMSDGLIRSAGVSNYTVEHLEELLDRSELVPAVNQVEFHPYIYVQQRPVLEFCRDQSIFVEAYSPLRRVGSEDTPALQTVAERHGKSPQQIVLRWCIQQDSIPLPRSRNSDHLRSNFEVFDFELSDQDMRELNSISDGERVTWDPAGMGD